MLTGDAERVDSNIDTDVAAQAEFIIAVFGGEYLDWVRGGLGQLDNLLSQARGIVDDLVARRTIVIVREEVSCF